MPWGIATRTMWAETKLLRPRIFEESLVLDPERHRSIGCKVYCMAAGNCEMLLEVAAGLDKTEIADRTYGDWPVPTVVGVSFLPNSVPTRMPESSVRLRGN